MTSRADVLQRLAELFFGFAFGIDIRCIEKIDAGVQRRLHHFVGAVLIDLADILEAALPAERHGAEANLRDIKAGAAEHVVFHRRLHKTLSRHHKRKKGGAETPPSG